MLRRDLLRLAVGAPLAVLGGKASAIARAAFGFDTVKDARASAVGLDESTATAVRIDRTWQGRVCRSRVLNTSARPVALKEVVLFDVPVNLPADTPFYGEGFQMLTQTGGTLGLPVALGNYTDSKHYKLPEPAAARAVYGLMTLSPGAADHHVLAFTSCRRFSGKFYVAPDRVRVVIDTEGLVLPPRSEWLLEEFAVYSGADRDALLSAAADGIARHHPRLRWAAPPSGWCSWYCFGPRVTARQVLDNLEVIAREIPGLKYIQIDDGYQPAMGDWLETGAAFGGDVRSVLARIRERGFEPAIWVAPFIAEEGSRLFRAHPDWFVMDADRTPLRSDKVTFGGWRRGPWYVLDGTHPDAQSYLTHVFSTMRREWGCSYFKLDANTWGAIHGGRFHDPGATRIEAYRRGMAAVGRGAGDGFLLGCNHPIWPSLGLIHGSRSSNDIKRTWPRVATTARQNLSRNWQNGRLWWNDPDAVVLTGELSEEEVRFHATALYATGGMVLSGDDLTTIPPARLDMLRRLQPPTGVAARFQDRAMRVATVRLQDCLAICLLNPEDMPQSLSFTLPEAHVVREVWTGEDLGRLRGGQSTVMVPAHAGRLLICRPA